MTTSASRPTSVRYRRAVVVSCALAAFDLFRSCVCITGCQRKPTFNMICAFPISKSGWILAAFWLTYGLAEIPIGSLGDRFGSRGILCNRSRLVNLRGIVRSGHTGFNFAFWPVA